MAQLVCRAVVLLSLVSGCSLLVENKLEQKPSALPDDRPEPRPDGGVPDALVAEPGFSALVRIEKAGRQRTLSPRRTTS